VSPKRRPVTPADPVPSSSEDAAPAAPDGLAPQTEAARPKRRRVKPADPVPSSSGDAAQATPDGRAPETGAEKPKRRRAKRADPAPSSSEDAAPATTPDAAPEAANPAPATSPDVAAATDRVIDDAQPSGSIPSPDDGLPVLRPAVTTVADMRGAKAAVPSRDPSEAPTSLQPSAVIAPEVYEITPCPNCGRTRTGQFRYCLTCGFDYDVAVRASSVRPWLIDIPRDWQLRPTGARTLIRTIPVREPEPLSPPPAIALPEPPLTAATREGMSVGAGRFILTRGMVIAGAIAVGVVAAIIVTLLAVVLTRLYGSS
jgi:hypothetical protein